MHEGVRELLGRGETNGHVGPALANPVVNALEQMRFSGTDRPVNDKRIRSLPRLFNDAQRGRMRDAIALADDKFGKGTPSAFGTGSELESLRRDGSGRN